MITQLIGLTILGILVVSAIVSGLVCLFLPDNGNYNPNARHYCACCGELEENCGCGCC